MILRGNVYSTILEMDTGISFVTPSVMSSSEPYKVVYLLHGLCGNHNTWIDYSMLADYAREGNTVFILPEVARSFYANMTYGLRYFDYITQELPKICQNIFNISAKREDTAIMGNSMGGYGALKIALSYPEKYSFCGAFASSCLLIEQGFDSLRNKMNDPDTIAQFGQQLLNDFVSIFGQDITIKEEDNLLKLLDKLAISANKPTLFLSCGNEDYFYPDHLAFLPELEKQNINYEFQHWTGNHTYAFFNESLKRALDYLGW